MSDCIQTKGYIRKDGYVLYTKLVNGKRLLAHRFVYEQQFGPIPEKMTIDHLCKNRACVNVNHLELVTLQENIRRSNGMSVINRIKTHCPSGHEFNEENIYLYKNKRHCKKCRKNWNQSHPRKFIEGVRIYV